MGALRQKGQRILPKPAPKVLHSTQTLVPRRTDETVGSLPRRGGRGEGEEAANGRAQDGGLAQTGRDGTGLGIRQINGRAFRGREARGAAGDSSSRGRYWL